MGYRVFNGVTGIRKILVKGLLDNVCSYQISYSELSTPIKTVTKNIPY